MDIKQIAISAGTALVIAVIAVWGFAPDAQIVREVQKLGAAASPDIQSDWLRFGGVTRFAYATNNLNQASSTVCTIQSPAATSTLVSGGIRFDVASSTQWVVEIGKGVHSNATTTLLGTGIIVANGQGLILASSTFGLGVDPAVVFAPNTYFNVKAPTAGGGTPSGHCHAVFETYQ
jgi:hypothetical protein